MAQYDLNVILNPNLDAAQLAVEKEYIENAIKIAGGVGQSPHGLRDPKGPRRVLLDLQARDANRSDKHHSDEPAFARPHPSRPRGQTPSRMEHEEEAESCLSCRLTLE
jgi:hypothetical protein